MISPWVRERLANYMRDQLRDNLISTTYAKNLNVNLNSRSPKDRELTNDEIREVSETYGNRFMERYLEIVANPDHLPTDEEAKALSKECIEYAFEQFNKRRQT